MTGPGMMRRAYGLLGLSRLQAVIALPPRPNTPMVRLLHTPAPPLMPAPELDTCHRSFLLRRGSTHRSICTCSDISRRSWGHLLECFYDPVVIGQPASHVGGFGLTGHFFPFSDAYWVDIVRNVCQLHGRRQPI